MSASREKKQRQDVTSTGITEKQRREMKEAQKQKAKKIAYWITGIVVAVLVIALLVWNSGVFQRNTKAATVGGKDYTVADVSYYYGNVVQSVVGMQSQYASFYQQLGMTFTNYYDTTKSASEQTITEETLSAMAQVGLSGPEVGETFADYFKREALDGLQYEALMCAEAKAEGFTISDEGKESVKATVKNYEAQANSRNYSLTSYLRAIFGEYMTPAVFKEHLTNSTLAREYEQHKKDSYSYTEDQLTGYYNDNKGLMDTYEYRVAFIDGQPEAQTDAEGNPIEATEAEKATAMTGAKAKADTMADLVRAGNDFNETAAQYVAEANQAQYADPEYGHTTGTLGTNLTTTAYGQWLTGGTHKAGDVGVVEETGGTGYYVVQFLNSWLDKDSVYSADLRSILIKAEIGADEDVASTETPAPTDTAEPSDTAEPEETTAPESTEPTTPSEAQYEAAKAKAEEIKAEFESGDKTAESFAALVAKYSADESTKENGGLYENVNSATTTLTSDIKTWALDPARQPGDLTIVQNTQQDQYGYQLIYFQKAGPKVWVNTAETSLRNDDYQTWFDGLKETYAVSAIDKGFALVTD